MIKCLDELVGETIEVYVDDIVVKSREANQIIHDLGLTFAKLKKNGIKLNPKTCVFGVP